MTTNNDKFRLIGHNVEGNEEKDLVKAVVVRIIQSTAETDRIILRSSWIAVLIALTGEGLAWAVVPGFSPHFWLNLLLSSCLPLLPVSLWVARHPHSPLNRYLIGLSLIATVTAINYVMEDGAIVYSYLLVEILMVLYQDRVLLYAVAALGAASYTVVLLFRPEYLADNGIPGDATDWIAVYLAFALSAFLLDIVARRLIGHAWQIKELGEMARHDMLTGLPNRDVFWEFLQRSIDSTRQGLYKSTAMIMLDVDRFKELNDSHGHLAGDALLATLAQALRESVRSSDLPCRYAGDEFVIVLPGASRDEALQVLERIRHRLDPSGAFFGTPLTVSAGISLYPEEGQDARTLVAAADAAMYADKKKAYTA